MCLHAMKNSVRIQRLNARIDPAKFDLANGSRDLLQGGVIPVVREGYIGLGDDKFAIALGDAHATVDPLMGQGANMASYSAFVLGEEIVKQSVIDERFCQIVDDKRRDRVECAHPLDQFVPETAPPGNHAGGCANE